jgi:hypothetical protein
VDDRNAGQVSECYQHAHEYEPANPYYLAAMLGFEMYRTRSSNLPEIMRTTIREAIKTCRQHAEAEIELPYALFTSGRLHLLLNESDRALSSYARGLLHCLNGKYCVPADVIAGEIEWIGRLHFGSRQQPFAHQRANTLLNLGHTILHGGVPTPVRGLKPPVLIVAGGAASLDAAGLDLIRPLLQAALREFRGTVISGGTTTGLPGCVGDLAGELGAYKGFELLGYAPERLPHGVTAHVQYDKLIGAGDDFSADQVLLTWTDILAAGIRPNEVLLLGFGGGSVSALEYRLALALGAEVGMVVVNEADAADQLLRDPLWSALSNLYPLPIDKATLHAFVIPADHVFEPALQQEMAKAFHSRYLINNAERLPPNMRPWSELDDTFKKANIEQAKYSVEILAAAGFGVREAKGEPLPFADFTDSDIEIMAKMEHGRWNVERLRDGWRFGERDDAKKLHDCLLPWEELPDKIKLFDRDAVRAFPAILAKANLEVYRV